MILQVLFLILFQIVIIGGFLPLSNKGHWWIRAFDFPRMIFFTLNIILLLSIYKVFPENGWVPLGALLLTVTLALDLYRIFPYTPLASVQSKAHEPTDREGHPLRLLSVNVLATNHDGSPLLHQIKTMQPDIVALAEASDFWSQWAKKKMQGDYPFQLHEPRKNGYGLVFLSRIPILESEIRYPVDDRVPAMVVDLQLSQDQNLKVFVIHPRPPRPQDGPSDERDAELLTFAEEIKDCQDPVIVMGDLNDVSWSHTTRLFLRQSQLLDPRRGRGIFNTIPSFFPWIGFPLDHVFHSANFELGRFEVLPAMGSDHRPVFAKLYWKDKEASVGSPDQPKPGDQQEAEELKKRGEEWDGPNQRLTYE